MIVLEKLSKRFGKKPVVEQVSTQFEKGKVTSIIGPNGAGKSTVLGMMARLLERDQGRVYIDETELANWQTQSLAKRLAVLKQSNSMNMRFTVEELVSFGRFPHSQGKLQANDRQKVATAMAYLGLTDLANRYLDELSGGQRQLAFIAMVLAQDTDYVLLDEPLNNLDIKHSLTIMKNIQALARDLGKAVIIVIHDINFAASYSDYIVALKNGAVMADGKVDEVIDAKVLESIYEVPFNIVEVQGKKMCTYY
ncbi:MULTISPECIES: ABC transporter ATP-binding protein [unclassified Vibrio]|uniref:ABC transporter ATP-binding protein n=1 Tax=Vibrio sp. HB236076 TaxID=3232307 RepID=A0AB39HE25_9VIBR|nr:ATP-binding cassette domain-containing protein [Vibrio sp. HB161653]MDP5252817.1 ATP-binding cassette domain-containing protein [Vibrio sp. HB161653]